MIDKVKERIIFCRLAVSPPPISLTIASDYQCIWYYIRQYHSFIH